MSRNRLLTLLGSICLAVLLAVLPSMVACAPEEVAPVPEKQIVWRFRSGYASTGFVADLMHHFINEVSEGSNGRLVIEPYFSGALGYKSTEALSICKDGLVDVTDVIPPTVQGEENAFGCGSLPFLFFGFDKYLSFLKETIKPMMTEVLEERWNSIVVVTYIEPLSDIYTNEPIKSLDDFKGKKIRIYGGPKVDWIKAMGAEPIFISVEDVYTALQRGMVDAAITSVTTATELHFWEVLKYRNSLEHVDGVTFWIVNKDSFNALPKDIQEVVLKAGDDTSEYSWNILRQVQAELTQELVDNGMIDNKIPEPVLEVCRDRAVPLLYEWAAGAGSFGEEFMKAVEKAR